MDPGVPKASSSGCHTLAGSRGFFPRLGQKAPIPRQASAGPPGFYAQPACQAATPPPDHQAPTRDRQAFMPQPACQALTPLPVHLGFTSSRLVQRPFGGGGHTKAILRASPEVTVVVLDRDPTAFSLAQQLAKEHSGRVHPLLGRFSELGALLSRLRLQPGSVDAVLLDAGSCLRSAGSSLCVGTPTCPAPLTLLFFVRRYPDMPCAADVVNALDQQALASILTAYGEERHTRKIASAMVEARSVYPITRTQQLASMVAGSFAASALYAHKDRLQRPSHVATKTFQVLRMFVNDELNDLHAGLCTAQTVLKPGGRLCVLTFHSLEDRLVKRFLHGEDVGAPPRRSVRQRVQRWEEEEEEEEKGGEKDSGHWVDLQRGVLMPQAEDVLENPWGFSAKLRAAFKQ
ncbi:12S rRNA N4-methylcytidine methyltransferase-like [Oncorhynchus tshawytscha]|uniref:12S rRNA N4-methylcytidine methyltransferase-like n=1 Tax=Oncorhynchus tshawytscha TaxID=74940 RepID=UPI001C3CC738|nr:12S rRNA N4-methylcytidine methyltransferase-like [Oncorhynchus tshawytscha]